MHAAFFEFNQACNIFKVDVQDRGTVLALAIALAVNRQAALPTAATDEPETFYRHHVAAQTEHLIDKFNESAVFNYDACVEFAKQLWKIRYEAVYPCELLVPTMSGTFFESISGVSRFIPEASKAVADKYKREICMISNAANVAIIVLTAA